MDYLLKGTMLGLAVLLLLGWTPVNALARTGQIQGTVTDASTSQPLAGVSVVARPDRDGPPALGQGQGKGRLGGGGGGGGGHHGFRAITGEDGTYTLEVPAGEYHVKAYTQGYFPAHEEATVTEGGTTTLDFVLDPLTYGTIAGIVTDAGTGQPLEGVMIGARPDRGDRPPLGQRQGKGRLGGGHGGGPHGFHAMTGEDGTYSLELPTGDYQVKACMEGYFPGLADATVLEGQTTTVDFALDPLTFGTLTGTVTDSTTSAPIEGAFVMLRRAGGHLLGGGPHGGGGHGGGHHGLFAITGEDGTYSIEDVPVGDYMARAWAFGYLPAEPVDVTIIEGETTVQDFALDSWDYGQHKGQMTPQEGAAIRKEISNMWSKGATMEEIHAAAREMMQEKGIELPDHCDLGQGFHKGHRGFMKHLTEEQRAEIHEKVQEMRSQGATMEEIHAAIAEMMHNTNK